MDNIRDIVHHVFEKIVSKKQNDEEGIERLWQDILDEKEQKHMRLMGIKDHHVSVYVDSPAWLYEMNNRKSHILKKIKTKFPEVETISFKIGKIR